jgi:serine protease Do
MMTLLRSIIFVLPALALPATAAVAVAADHLSQIIDTVKPSVVGIGSLQKTRSPALSFIGTGFVVDDGLSVVTAAHVVTDLLNSGAAESLGVLVRSGDNVEFRPAAVVVLDKAHDLARLRINGAPLPALQLGDSNTVREGKSLAFTGFPLGMILGLHHVTHRCTVSAITPVATPPASAGKLDSKLLSQLQKPAYDIFQLDGTAYPGSSGSPLFDPDTGLVIGIVNMVFVKGVKETAISAPSGITYAIPSNFITRPAAAK